MNPKDKGQFGRGVVLFTLFTRLLPNIVEGHTNLAVTYERMNRPEDSKRVLREAMKQFPDNIPMRHSLVRGHRT